ncbi:MAG: hypothetical protein PVG39_09335 [Desulfobacteraceae bacterium]
MPEEKYIYIEIKENDKWINIFIKGFLPKHISDKVSPELLSQTLNDIALGEKIIQRFVKNQGGQYYDPDRKDGQIVFRIDLPITEKRDR